MSAMKEKVIGLVNYQQDKDYIPSSSRRPSNRDRLSARSLLSNDKILHDSQQLSARSLVSLESDDNVEDGGLVIRNLMYENSIVIQANEEENNRDMKELRSLRKKVAVLETTVQEACKLVTSLLPDDNSNNIRNVNSIDDKEDLLPLLTSISSHYRKLHKSVNDLNTDIESMKESHKSNSDTWEDQMLMLQKVVKDLQDEDVKNKRMINVTIHQLESEKDYLKSRNQELQLQNSKLLQDKECLNGKIQELEGAVLDIPRLEDKYLREAKKIVHEKALDMAQVQINMKKMEKEVQSLAYYQFKVKDLEEQNTRLRLANESLQRQCRITLRKVHNNNNNNSTNFNTKTSINNNDNTSKVKQRPVSASAVLSSINIEDSFEKSSKNNNESYLLLSELKLIREKNYNLEQMVSSLRHKLAIARAYPLKSASAGPLEVELKSNKTFKNTTTNSDAINTNDSINVHMNTRTSLLGNEDDDESYYNTDNIKEREEIRHKRTEELSSSLRNKILVRQTTNQEHDPHTESIRKTKKFPKQMKILNKFLN